MSADEPEVSGNMILGIAVGSALMNFTVLTVLGLVLFEDIVFGVVVGLFMGVGSYFFIPWLLLNQAEEPQLSDGAGDLIQTANDFQKGALGLAMEAGGIVMVIAWFVEEDATFSIAAGIAALLAIFLVASVFFRRMN